MVDRIPISKPISAAATPVNALFQGFDSITGGSRASAVTGAQNTTNAAMTSYVKICTSSDDVTSALNVSASISDSFGVGSVDAKASFVQSLSLTETSVCVVVYSRVVSGVSSYDSVNLSVTAPTPATLQTFYDDYGDSFVSVIQTGGEYYAVFTFNSTTQSAQQSITASLSGSGGGVSGSLSTALTNATSSSNTTVSLQQQMTGVTNQPLAPEDADAIVTFALQTFPSLTIDAPTILTFETTGYENVPGVSGFTVVAANRAVVQGNAEQGIPGLAQNFAQLSTANKAAKQLTTAYAAYGNPDPDFETKAAQIATDYAAVVAAMQAIPANIGSAYTPPALPSIAYGVPTMQYSTTPLLLPVPQSVPDVTPPMVAAGVSLQSITACVSDDPILVGMYGSYSNGIAPVHGTEGATSPTYTFNAGDTLAQVEVFPQGFSITTVAGASQFLGTPGGPAIQTVANTGGTCIGLSFPSTTYYQWTPVFPFFLVCIEMGPTTWIQPSDTTMVSRRTRRHRHHPHAEV